MRYRLPTRLVAVAIAGVLFLGACDDGDDHDRASFESNDENGEPEPTDATSESAAASDTTGSAVDVDSAPTGGDDGETEADNANEPLESRAISGGVVEELRVMDLYRIGDTVTVEIELDFTESSTSAERSNLHGETMSDLVTLVDEANGKRHYALHDTADNCLCTTFDTPDAGGTVVGYADFPAPPADVTALSVHFNSNVFRNVPVRVEGQ